MTVSQFLDGRITLHAGDCLDVLAAMPENSVDSVVTDPPYHLTSIVKRFGAEAQSHLSVSADKDLSKVNSNPHRRLAAGFMGKEWDGGDIAFQPDTWRAVLRVLKPGGYILAFASSRGFGRMSVAIEDAGFINHPMFGWIFGSGFPKATRIKAEGYEGFRYGGQASKPALEPIYMGQKPFSEETGTANILRWGTGAVNIDGCRVASDDELREGASKLWSHYREGEESSERTYAEVGGTNFAMKPGPRGGSPLGRWPANIIHDGSAEVIAAFPEAPRQQQSVGPQHGAKTSVDVFGDYGARDEFKPRGDEGSAARFFYSAKADAEDRVGSKHPTVKPLDLIQYLVRYITPPGGVVLDPFAGTGTTGEAAFREGMRAVLIEREPEYQADIERRMDLAQNPTKRAAVAKTKNNLQGAEGTPLFGVTT